MNTNLWIAQITLAANLITLTIVTPFDGRLTVDAKCRLNDGWSYSGWANMPMCAGTNQIIIAKPPCGATAFFRVRLTN